MKKSLLIILFLLGFGIISFAEKNDSISTHYINKQFINYCQIYVNASYPVVDEVVEDFIDQAKYDLDKLFKWGLKNMDLRTDKNKLIAFNFKSTKYDEENDIINAVGDVRVPGIISFPDINVSSRMKKNKNSTVHIHVLKSDAFLKETIGVFNVIQHTNGKCTITLETQIKFGWFFNVFITQPLYKAIMEWRFKQMMLNIKEEAEKRQKAVNQANTK